MRESTKRPNISVLMKVVPLPTLPIAKRDAYKGRTNLNSLSENAGKKEGS